MDEENKDIKMSKKSFWKDKKNIAIIILSFLLLCFVAAYSDSNTYKYSSQIEELTKLLVRRGEELANLNMRWRERQNRVEIEKQNLAAQVSALETENIVLKEKVASLERENKKLEEIVASQSQKEQKKEEEDSLEENITVLPDESMQKTVVEGETINTSLFEQEDDSVLS